MENRFGGTSEQQRNQRPEGEVYVSNGAKKEKIVDQDIGDYVDYEEM